MESKSGTGISDFVKAICSDWFSRMSGPISVPAAIVALWVDNDTAKILLGGTAFICLWITAYFVWKREREKNDSIKNPGSSVEFIKLIPARGGSGYDLEIKNPGFENIENCIVKIESIDVLSGSAVSLSMFPIVLVPKSQLGHPTQGSFNLLAGERCILSFVYRAPMPSGWIGLDYLQNTKAFPTIFQGIEKCEMKLAAYGAKQPSNITAVVDRGEGKEIKAALLGVQSMSTL